MKMLCMNYSCNSDCLVHQPTISCSLSLSFLNT